MHHAAIRKFNKDTLFFILNGCFLGLLTLIVLYPLYFVVIASISDPDAVLLLYPFVQKYFAQGVMIGSLKG